MAHTVRTNDHTLDSTELSLFLDDGYFNAYQHNSSPFNSSSSRLSGRIDAGKSRAGMECAWSGLPKQSIFEDNRTYQSITIDRNRDIPPPPNDAELCTPRTFAQSSTAREQSFHNRHSAVSDPEPDPPDVEDSAYRSSPHLGPLVHDSLLPRSYNRRAHNEDLPRALQLDFSSSVMNDVCQRRPDTVENEIQASHYCLIDAYNGLPANDPRREHDFAQFLDNRRFCSPDGNVLSQFECSPEHVRGLKRRSREIIHERNSKADIQGLNWRLIGFSRRTILDARRRLHRYMRNTASLQTTQSEPKNSDANHRERHFGSRMYAPQHEVHYNHYQLRHVLAAACRDAIFYPGENNIVQTSLACASSASSVIDLGTSSEDRIRVTCMTYSPPSSVLGYSSDSFLLAGDYDGGYVILDLNSQDSKTAVRGRVSDAYDGLVTHVNTFCQRKSGLYGATFCSNDQNVRRMDVRTQCFTRESSYDCAINCTATSPDSRLELLVGDSNDAFVRDTERGDLLVTLKTHTDHSFGCAWSSDGLLAATGSQDGLVALWDCRKWAEPLRAFASVVTCPRSLHFTDDGLLVSAEEDDCVSVFDTRNLDERQDIRFFGSIAGVALLNGGEEMVVANADRTVGGLLSFQRKASRFEPQSGGTRESRRPGADLFGNEDFEAGLCV